MTRRSGSNPAPDLHPGRSWYHFGTDRYVRYVQAVHARGTVGTRGTRGTRCISSAPSARPRDTAEAMAQESIAVRELDVDERDPRGIALMRESWLFASRVKEADPE
jgi:hypothetical protein